MRTLAVEAVIRLPIAERALPLIRHPEDQWFERKSARVASKDLANTLVAMANAEGGAVVVGIHDGEVEGVSTAALNTLRQCPLDYTDPPVRVHAEEVEVQDATGAPATVLVMFVEPGEELHTTRRGDCFLRVGDESRKLSPTQQRELGFDRGTSHFEARASQAELSDLDAEQLAGFVTTIGSTSSEKALEARDLVTRRGQLNVAGLLLLGKRPQADYPSAVVRVLRYGSDQRGRGSAMTLEEGADVRFDGSIPKQILAAAEIMERWIPKWEQLGPAGLFEATSRIPRDAWLEGLVNAAVHRSYSMMGDHIRVEIFPNKVEITSPGRFPGIVSPERALEIRRYARNPRIARVCTDLGLTRELGEGIQRMFEQMRLHGLLDPVYEQSSSSVTLTLWAVDSIPDEVRARLTASASRILTALRQMGEPLGTGALADLAGVTRMTATRALAQLEEEGLVTWRGTSKRDPRATWTLGKLG